MYHVSQPVLESLAASPQQVQVQARHLLSLDRHFTVTLPLLYRSLGRRHLTVTLPSHYRHIPVNVPSSSLDRHFTVTSPSLYRHFTVTWLSLLDRHFTVTLPSLYRHIYRHIYRHLPSCTVNSSLFTVTLPSLYRHFYRHFTVTLPSLHRHFSFNPLNLTRDRLGLHLVLQTGNSRPNADI